MFLAANRIVEFGQQPLPAGGGTAMAAGLGGGGDRPLWFKLDLTAYDAVQGETITHASRTTYRAPSRSRTAPGAFRGPRWRPCLRDR